MSKTAYRSRTGRQYTIREIRPEDADLLVDLFHHLSPETIYKRFHAVMDPQTLPRERIYQEAVRLSTLDPEIQAALVALHEDHIVGVARLHRIPGTADAESAIVVRDDYQQDGLGTFLLAQLREKALSMGIDNLVAIVHAQNHPIHKVIQHSGLKSQWRFEQGESYLVVDIHSLP